MKEKRINEIADYIGRNNTVTLQHLAKHFNVSIYTIRRDINELLEKNIIVKHYGGVSINNQSHTLIGFEDRNTINKASKEKISQLSSLYIHDNDIIFIDAGTTTMYLADYIVDKNITVITHSVHIINKLANIPNIKLIILGGELDHRTYSLVGYQTLDYLKRLNITKCFLGSSGISLDSELTNYTVVEADIKRLCLEISKKAFLLVDTTKFDRTSLITYGRIDELDMVITDKKPNERYLKYFNDNGIEVRYE